MPKTLDRSRPFGEVWGSENSVRYVQDEIEFDAEGNEIVSAVADQAPAARRRKAAAPEQAPSDVDQQLAAQTGAEG